MHTRIGQQVFGAMNLSRIDLNLLVILDALVATQSVSEAGERVGLSQPAVSHALGRLRDLLRDPILERDGRKMRLTPRAKELREPIRTALQVIKSAIEDPAPFDSENATANLKLFASDFMSATIGVPLQRKLLQRAPGLNLVIKWGDRRLVPELLESEAVDVAIGHYENAPHFVRRAPLCVEKVAIQARRDHPAFESWSAAALRDYPLLNISFEGALSGWIDQATGRAGLGVRSKLIMPHFLAAPLMLVDSDFLAITSERLSRIYAEILPLTWRPAPFPVDDLLIEMVWHARSERDPMLTWFRELILETASELT
jgi:DNA-binding transcriptional LysR family regulator